MSDNGKPAGSGASVHETADQSPASADQGASMTDPNSGSAPKDESEYREESLTQELASLFDDGRTYAEAEFGFQKARAGFAGKQIGAIVLYAALALVVLIIALIVLAFGVMVALTPTIGIWSAMALVVGVLLIVVGGLLFVIKRKASALSKAFADDI